ncbi:unnamed protein product [Trichogramma brassicae]|uniref:Peptidase S1 domain-containing protein n=1 Tax=Trichogramma brassicae TaxID=86971 RepID=A0A6H5IZK9_9HYME|nr:unnamed protein product [Trichogramma brassicae]
MKKSINYKIKGDSGGPLYDEVTNTLIGIVSHRVNGRCGDVARFTRVSAFLDFINKVLVNQTDSTILSTEQSHNNSIEFVNRKTCNFGSKVDKNPAKEPGRKSAAGHSFDIQLLYTKHKKCSKAAAQAVMDKNLKRFTESSDIFSHQNIIVDHFYQDKWNIITAAHCVTRKEDNQFNKEDIVVVAGTTDLRSKYNAIYRDVAWTMIPKLYNPRRSYLHDVAILRGDSGSALVGINTDPTDLTLYRDTLIGITSHFVGDSSCGTGARYTRISEYLDFIRNAREMHLRDIRYTVSYHQSEDEVRSIPFCPSWSAPSPFTIAGAAYACRYGGSARQKLRLASRRRVHHRAQILQSQKGQLRRYSNFEADEELELLDGGYLAGPDEFKYQVSVQLLEDDCTRHICGGAILDKWHVITSPMCFGVVSLVNNDIFKQNVNYVVVAGTRDLRNKTSGMYHEVEYTYEPAKGVYNMYNNFKSERCSEIAILKSDYGAPLVEKKTPIGKYTLIGIALDRAGRYCDLGRKYVRVSAFLDFIGNVKNQVFDEVISKKLPEHRDAELMPSYPLC